MKAFSNYENVKAATERETLPKGGYLVVIKDAKVKEYQGQNGTFEKLEISLDIAQGEYKDFFLNDYLTQIGEDKRWRGVLRQYLPKDDGSEKDEWTKSAFKAMIQAIEESNPGYHWDWNEAGLKGKTAGCLFRSEEWEFNMRSGWRTAAFKLVPAELIKSGKFKIPADKPLKIKKPTLDIEYEEVSISDDDLPF